MAEEPREGQKSHKPDLLTWSTLCELVPSTALAPNDSCDDE